jgi:DNA-binding transcriptional ArsR family regulator
MVCEVERTTHVLDATSLKALAHPLRVRLLGLLRQDGPSTATALGARLGESSGTTSYHLRQLAGANLVIEDDTRGNARERWWRAAQHSTRLDAADWLDDPDVKPALDAYMSAILSTYAARAQAFLDEADSWPKRWSRAAEMSDYGLSLTAAELVRLNTAMNELVASFQREPRRGDEAVVVQFQTFPRRST